MKRYPLYKDSKVKWIGNVPEHWKLLMLKRLCSMRSGTNLTSWEISETGSYPVFGGNGQRGFYSQYNCDGDFILVGRQGALCGNVHHIIGKFWATDHALITACSKLVLPNYLNYLLLSMNLNQYASQTAAQPGLAASAILRIKTLNPSINEQLAIVAFLDRAVEKIDGYIAAKEAEIEKLGTLKQSVIAKAVTQGLNPDAPMKDSGIPWLGNVPEHWNVSKINQYFSERREKVSDKDYAPLSVAKAGVVPQLADACKTDNGDNRKLVKAGDFVVNSRSDRKGSCGVSALDGSVSLINIVLIPRNINRAYIHYLFRSNDYIEEFYRNGRGIVADLWTTRYSEMKNIFIPIPPADEQQTIVDYISRKTQEIDGFITGIRAQIEKLKVYKQRLISDVVTGKICVCNPFEQAN